VPALVQILSVLLILVAISIPDTRISTLTLIQMELFRQNTLGKFACVRPAESPHASVATGDAGALAGAW